jgi:hypothetical protein
MKKILLWVLLIPVLFSFNASASHYAGGDFRIQWIGGNDYSITFILYRDCSGIPAPTTVDILLQSSCGNFNMSLPEDPLLSDVEITPVCPGTSTWCSNGTMYGISRFVYEDTVTLPPCSDWEISYNLCCRNPDNTLNNPTSSDWYIPIKFNNADAPDNSTPYFGNMPIMIIFSDHDYCYNHGVVDPENDSLTYKLVFPMADYNVPVTFIPPFDEQQFLASTPPITNDTLTGDICMHPTLNLIAVFAVEVTEWRNINNVPTIISKIVRDMQVEVISGNNSLPTLAGINPNATQYDPADTTYELTIFAGDTVDFNLYPFDSISTADLTLNWNNGITDGQFTVNQNNTPNCMGHFHWIATSSSIPYAPRCFTANIRDDNCPYFGEQTFSYCFTVKGLKMSLSPANDTSLLLGQSYDLIAHASKVDVYDWQVDGISVFKSSDSVFNVDATTLGAGDHVVSCWVYNYSDPDDYGFEYVLVHVENSWGINATESNKISVYPNPANELLVISARNMNTEVFYSLSDANGRLLTKGLLNEQNAFNVQIELSGFSSGLMLLKLWNDQLFDVRKIILNP